MTSTHKYRLPLLSPCPFYFYYHTAIRRWANVAPISTRTSSWDERCISSPMETRSPPPRYAARTTRLGVDDQNGAVFVAVRSRILRNRSFFRLARDETRSRRKSRSGKFDDNRLFADSYLNPDYYILSDPFFLPIQFSRRYPRDASFIQIAASSRSIPAIVIVVCRLISIDGTRSKGKNSVLRRSPI